MSVTNSTEFRQPTQESLGMNLVLEAQHWYKRLPTQTAFCISEFDLDETTIKMFRGKSQKTDAEQEMCKYVKKFTPQVLTAICKWTPCELICSSEITKLPISVPSLKYINIYFIEMYNADVKNSAVNASTALERMNTVVTEQTGISDGTYYTKIRCEPLPAKFMAGVVPASRLKTRTDGYTAAVQSHLGKYFDFT